MHDVTLWDHLLALFVGIVLPVAGAVQHGRGASDAPAPPEDLTTRDRIAMYWANSLVLAVLAGLTLLVWRLGGRTLAELGLTVAPRETGIGLAMTLVFLVLYGADTLYQLGPRRLHLTRERWRRDTPFMPTSTREVRHGLVLAVSAAVFEEIVFRGFLIPYVAHFTGSTSLGLTLAVALPGLVFAVCHLYQGVHAAMKIALLASFVGAILVVTGSLWIPIVLHFVIDLIGVLLGPRLLAPPGGSSGAH